MSGHSLDTHSSPRPPSGGCVRYSPLHSLTALPAGSVSPFPLRLSPRSPRLIHLYAFPPRTHSLIHSSQSSADGGQEKEDDGRKKKARSLSIPVSLDSPRVRLRSCYRQQMAKSDIYCESSLRRANVSCANRLLRQHGMWRLKSSHKHPACKARTANDALYVKCVHARSCIIQMDGATSFLDRAAWNSGDTVWEYGL